MKWALLVRNYIYHKDKIPELLETRVVDRLFSMGLECCHDTRRSAQAHASAINAKREGWRAEPVKVTEKIKLDAKAYREYMRAGAIRIVR